MNNKITYTGGCHCGAVRFEVLALAELDVIDCNCSICVMKGNRHFIIPEADFKLLKGEEYITCYTFNTHQAKHTFCKVCGVQSFYSPRSNPDGKGIAFSCLDPHNSPVTFTNFDGQNWEETMKYDTSIRRRSKC